jgi:hypothetical protein
LDTSFFDKSAFGQHLCSDYSSRNWSGSMTRVRPTVL